MASEFRKTGISVVGDAPWGTHFCHFYETKQDLLDTLIPYFKAGLESREFCLWVVSDSDLITMAEAKGALAQAVPNLDRHLADEDIEILSGHDWYFEQQALNLERAKHGWDAKLKLALARGYEGLRASADTFWLAEKDWQDFFAYEKQVNDWITNQSMTVLCTYPLAKSGAAEVLDVAQAHQFVIARRQGEWETIETPRLIQAKAEIQRLNEELEQRVVERTNELRVANEELRNEIAERKQAQALLHAKEQEFRAIVENAPDQVARYDRSGRRTYVNPAFAKALDLSAEALIGKPLFSVVREAELDVKEDELAQIRQRFENVFETGESCEFEVTVPMPTERRYFNVRFFPELDLNGSVINVLAIARDITERKEVERDQRESRLRYETLVQSIDGIVWEADPQTFMFTFVSKQAERILGYPLEQWFEGPGFWPDHMHPDDRDWAITYCVEATARGEDHQFEYRMIAADGRVVWLNDIVSLHVATDQSLILRGLMVDITERKQAEEALKQSENQLAEAQRLAHVGSFEWDLRSNAVTWSDELCHIFDLQPGKISGAGDAMPFIHREDRDLVRNAVMSAVKNKEPYGLYYRIVRPDGAERIVHTRGHIVSDENGDPIRVFGATQDVTELKRAEEKLKASREQLRALSASLQSAREEEGTRIARELHDELGSALTSLRWSLDEIDNSLSNPASTSNADTLREKIAAMTTLVAETLHTVQRISAELRPGILDDVGLTAAIRWEAQQYQARTGIICRFESPLENVQLSRKQSTAIFRIFQEALTNVLRHASATTVDITIQEPNGEFVLQVSDNGKGMKEANTTEPESLGLLGMRERAHLIGGEVSITSAVGRGAVVTVRVPV
jgi:PAS domain S-box-containing protein